MFNVKNLLFIALISLNANIALSEEFDSDQTATTPLQEEIVADVAPADGAPAQEGSPSLASTGNNSPDEELECTQSNPCCNLCCEDWIYLEHTEGRWLDNNQGYTSLGIFLPLPVLGSKFLPFVDLREHLFNNGKTAGNFGAGLRFIDYETSTAFGVNAFFDYRKASWNHYFYQLGLGFEVLTPCYDFRVNTYLPIGEKYGHSKLQVFNLGDGFQAICRERRSSMYGYDLEIGRWLKKALLCDYLDLYGAIGFYSFFPQKHHQIIYGGEARLVSRFGRYVSFEIKGGYDCVFHGLVQGKIALNIPFDIFKTGQCCSKECCCSYDIVCQPVYRQEIIPLNNKECCCTWNWDD